MSFEEEVAQPRRRTKMMNRLSVEQIYRGMTRRKRPRRDKHPPGTLQRLRAQRGVGRPPAQIVLPIKTDLVRI